MVGAFVVAVVGECSQLVSTSWARWRAERLQDA